MERKITILILTFLLTGDFFFLDYYYEIRFAILIFSLILLRTSSHTDFDRTLKCYIKPICFFLILCALQFAYFAYAQESFLSLFYIPRGFSLLIQNLITIILAFAILKQFKEGAVNILVWSFVLAYSVCIVNGVIFLGPLGLIQYAFDFSDDKIAAGNFALNQMFEIHSLGLSFPALIAYFWISKKITGREAYDKRLFWLLIFYTLLSLKRISIIACFVTCFTFVLLRNERLRNFAMKNAFYIFLFISFAILSVIYNPLFFDFITDNGIDLMGRQYLYKGICEESALSPSFIGNGWGWVSSYMKYQAMHDNIFNGILAVHNDILRLYVELGFFFFIGYNYIYYRYIPKALNQVNRDLKLLVSDKKLS